MKKKKRVLIVIDWFLPGFKAGGPIQSCYNLIKRMRPYFEFEVLTTDRDLGDKEPYPGIRVNAWNVHPDGFRIFYVKSRQAGKYFKKIISEEEYDDVYFNSFFSFRFTILPLWILKWHQLNAKIILAPRGMLGKGALEIKMLKKSFFIWFSKIINLYKNVTWHATSDMEAKEIKKAMGSAAKVVMVADTGTLREEAFHGIEKKVNFLKIIFISRISKKKNLAYALAALTEIAPGLTIDFHIYGPVEDAGYWQECRALIKKMNPAVSVHMGGEVTPEDVISLFAGSHLFFFPTQHENFGHVIHESLLASCPLLISDQTPWSDLQEKNAGYSLPLSDRNAFTSCLEKFAGMDQHEYDVWRRGAYQMSRDFASNDHQVADYIKIFD